MAKHVAIMGVTGAVGTELLRLLDERQFPLASLKPLASKRSAGKKIPFKGSELTVEELTHDSFKGIDIVLSAAGGAVSAEYAPSAVKAGAVYIDNSSNFRMDPEVPLIIPEINPETLAQHKGIISNPNCTTAIAAVALWPLHKAFGLKKVFVSTYQAASGAGAEGMAELEQELRNWSAGKPIGNKVFAHPLPFNVIPHIDVFTDNGYTKEEMKVTLETRKIFGLPHLPISCTAVRIPTLRAHSESIVIETERPVSADEARKVLAAAPGVKLVDDPANKVYPMPINASLKWDVEVGRVRQNIVYGDHGLEFFVSGDQILKGAARNTLQIAELLI